MSYSHSGTIRTAVICTDNVVICNNYVICCLFDVYYFVPDQRQWYGGWWLTWFLDNPGMLVQIVWDSWAQCEDLTTISLPGKYGDICLPVWPRHTSGLLLKYWSNLSAVITHHHHHHSSSLIIRCYLGLTSSCHCAIIETSFIILIPLWSMRFGLRQGSESEVSAHFLI